MLNDPVFITSFALSLLGICVGAILTTLLALTLCRGKFRIWPTRNGAWGSRVFWVLFRTLNFTAIFVAISDWGSLGLIDEQLRTFALVAALLFVIGYALSLHSLGRMNTYCQQAGLIETGIYHWSRNPQYATAIAAYCMLGLAADSQLALAPIALVVATYVLMAFAEEPWLKTAYPGTYDQYCRRVPRFFNANRFLAYSRLVLWQLPAIRSARRGLAIGEPEGGHGGRIQTTKSFSGWSDKPARVVRTASSRPNPRELAGGSSSKSAQ